MTRHFTVQLQSFTSDADRKKAIQAYGHALSHWLKVGRFKTLGEDKQEVLSAALDAFYASPVYDWLGPWRSRGLIVRVVLCAFIQTLSALTGFRGTVLEAQQRLKRSTRGPA